MSWRGSADDSHVAGGHSTTSPLSNELKTMTLGRRKNKIRQQSPSDADTPPPPTRSYSRRNEPTSSTTAPHNRTRALQSETAVVGGLVSSIASNIEAGTAKKSKPFVKLPPKKVEPEPVTFPKPVPSIKRRPSQKDSNQATGFLSAKAQLQAKLGGGVATNAREEPKIPTKTQYTPSDTKRVNDRSFPEEKPPPAKPTIAPPTVHRKSSPRPAANNRNSSGSSSGSGVFRIKESSSLESLSTSDPPLPPSIPPKGASKPHPITNKATRSKSMWMERIKPPAIEPTDTRSPIEHETAVQVTEQLHLQTDSVHNGTQGTTNAQIPLLKQPSGPMDFTTMISKGAHFFPTQVRVCNGFCSSICESFSKYDILQLHFVKHSKVGVLKDEFSDEEYTLPMSSSMEFGILYEAEGADVSQYIPRVEDLMALKPLPTVVLATKSYNAGPPEKSIEENELLFLKKVTKPLLGKGRVLEVCTLEGTVKKLAGKCEGDFSIHPMHIKISLSTLIQQSIPLPQRVYLLPDPADPTQEYLTDTMTQQPVYLGEIRGETSVICTVKGEQSIMDVSKDLGIQVEVVEVGTHDKQVLLDITQRLYNEFRPTTLSYVVEKSTEREYELQCLLNRQLLHGKEMDGVHLQLPSTLSHPTHTPHSTHTPQSTPPPTELAETISMASSDGLDSQNDYEDIGSALAKLPEEDNNRLNKVIKTKKKVSNFINNTKRLTTKRKKLSSDPPYEETTFSPPPPATIATPTPQQSVPSQKENYEPMGGGGTVEAGAYSDVRNTDKPLPALKEASQTPPRPETESNYVQMNSKIASIMLEINILKQQVQNLTLAVEGLRGSGGQPTGTEQRPVPKAATSSQPDKGEEEEMQQNREFLKTLSHQQVTYSYTCTHIHTYTHTLHTHTHTHTHTHYTPRAVAHTHACSVVM